MIVQNFMGVGIAPIASQGISIAIGLLFCVKNLRHGWPFLLVGSSFSLNELVEALLAQRDLLEPLTEFVGSINQPLAFAGSFASIMLLLAATDITGTSRGRSGPVTAGTTP